METLLLTDERPRKSLDVKTMRVPVGHELPAGEKTQFAFDILLEAGVRWHPEWAGPMVTVNAWQALPKGDALGYSGATVVDLFGSLLSPEVAALAAFHGQSILALDATGAASLKALGLQAPTKKEPYAAFILPCQRGRLH